MLKNILRHQRWFQNTFSFKKTARICYCNYQQISCIARLHPFSLFSDFHYLSSGFNNVKFWLNSRLICLAHSNEISDLADSILSSSSDVADVNKMKGEIIKVLNFLVSHGCNPKDIKEKGIQYLDISQCSYIKATLLAEVNSDLLMLLPLFSLSPSILRLAAKQAREDTYQIKDFPNRISYLCHHLELTLEELIAVLSKHSCLLTMKFRRLEHKMNILKSANINPKYIVKDLWIFNYNEKLLSRRIQIAGEAGVELKPWMLRCSERFFESMIVKFSETQRILNGKSEINYLAEKLDCSEEYVEYIMERNKSLKSINIPKIEQIINFLLEKGYTPQEIRLFPRVFCSSVETLNKRFVDFQNLKSTLPTISQLCISSRKFIDKLEKKK